MNDDCVSNAFPPISIETGVGTNVTAMAFGQGTTSIQCPMTAQGSTRWVKRDGYHGGFATVLPPNTRAVGPRHFDFVLESLDEDGGPRLRGGHVAERPPGGVNPLIGDSSVRFSKSTINRQTWQTLGTDAGGEIVGLDVF